MPRGTGNPVLFKKKNNYMSIVIPIYSQTSRKWTPFRSLTTAVLPVFHVAITSFSCEASWEARQKA